MGCNIKNLINKFNIRFSKSLGQNFVIDNNVIRRMIEGSQINRRDIVIEIGSGIGNLTREIALKAQHVIAVEIDKYLIPALEENISGLENITILNQDVLKINFNEIIKSLDVKTGHTKIVGNLPYYITTPVIMKFLEGELIIDEMCVMVQKEVAERIVAKPGCKDYGVLSIAVQCFSKPEILFTIPPDCFIPRPRVDSSVLRINVYKDSQMNIKNRNLFFKVVRSAFSQRRKTLVNALFHSEYFKFTKFQIKKILEELDLEEKIRGEKLSIMQFSELTNAILRKINKKTL